MSIFSLQRQPSYQEPLELSRNRKLFYKKSFLHTRTKETEPVQGQQGTALIATEIKNELGEGAATRFEIYGLFGLEYAINSILTLAAEYHLRFNMELEPDMKVTDPAGVETTTAGHLLSAIQGRLGIPCSVRELLLPPDYGTRQRLRTHH